MGFGILKGQARGPAPTDNRRAPARDAPTYGKIVEIMGAMTAPLRLEICEIMGAMTAPLQFERSWGRERKFAFPTDMAFCFPEAFTSTCQKAYIRSLYESEGDWNAG